MVRTKEILFVIGPNNRVFVREKERERAHVCVCVMSICGALFSHTGMPLSNT
jgi:hypothetical protein